MTLTQHGHHIPDTPYEDEYENAMVAPCDGVWACGPCIDDVKSLHGFSPFLTVRKPEELIAVRVGYDKASDEPGVNHYRDTFIARWCKGMVRQDTGLRYIEIRTEEGDKRAHPGDYIVKDDQGRIYVRDTEGYRRQFEKASENV